MSSFLELLGAEIQRYEDSELAYIATMNVLAAIPTVLGRLSTPASQITREEKNAQSVCS